jgi:hypothetical protein
MFFTQAPVRRRAARAARWLTALAIAGAATATAGAAQAQAANLAAVTRAAAATAITPQPITLFPGWSASAGLDSRPPAWFLGKSGIVHLEGAVSWTGSGPVDHAIGTVPPAAEPPSNTAVFTIANTLNGTYTDLQVDSNGGQLALIGAASPAETNYHFVSLEGISYRISGKTHPIQIPPDWSGNAGAGARAPAWYKDRSGIVHLQGAVKQISTSGNFPNVLGVLPLSAAPATETFYTVAITAPGTYADIAIQPSGAIDVIAPRPPAITNYAPFLSLESITFRAGDTGATPIPLAPDWSGSAGFNSRGPAWYRDTSGLIHLQGAVTQANPKATDPNLIGTLPAAAAPTHDVYTVVHTFNGTYAGLDIKPSGQIAVIDPPPTLVKDYSFVSLESIVYRR